MDANNGLKRVFHGISFEKKSLKVDFCVSSHLLLNLLQTLVTQRRHEEEQVKRVEKEQWSKQWNKKLKTIYSKLLKSLVKA